MTTSGLGPIVDFPAPPGAASARGCSGKPNIPGSCRKRQHLYTCIRGCMGQHDDSPPVG